MQLAQVEAGVGCPISMTYSAIPALRMQPEIDSEWEPRFLSLDYDERMVPAPDKAGALCGMGMTEKQGGSDVRANTTTARPAQRRRPRRRVRDQRPQVVLLGPDVRRVPRPRPGRGRRVVLPHAALHARTATATASISSASRTSSATAPTPRARSSSARAWARLVGEEGRGVRTIIEMVNHTRLDCAIGSTSGMRFGTAMATHHAAHRSVFGKLLARPAADAERARRPLRRVRGGDRVVDAPRARLRRVDRRRRRRDRVQAPRQRGAQVLDLQARPGALRRGARVPGRQRLRRGVGDAAPLPRDRRWPRSGRARETSSASTCCAAMGRSPASVEAFFAEVDEAQGADPRLDASRHRSARS